MGIHRITTKTQTILPFKLFNFKLFKNDMTSAMFYRHYVSGTNMKENTGNSLLYTPENTTATTSTSTSISTSNSISTSTSISNSTTVISSSAYPSPSFPTYEDYFKTLPKQTLFSLFLIGVCSLNKLTLSTATYIFPFIPLSLVHTLVSKLYCGGENMQEVLQCGQELQKRGISNMMLSLTIENSEGVKQIENIDQSIMDPTIESIYKVLKPNLLSQLDSLTDEQNINTIAPGYIALKPSALIENPNDVLMNYGTHPDSKVLFDRCARITQVIHDLNQQLFKIYPSRKSPFFVSTIDAEKFDWQTKGVYNLQRQLMQKFNRDPLISVAGTWQLYLSDSIKHLTNDALLAKQNGYRLALKIVRGAYIHSEPNRNSIIFRTKEDTDNNYDNIMTMVLNDMKNNGKDSVYGHLVVASHNAESQIKAAVLLDQLSEDTYVRANVSFGQLLGMSDNLAYDLINNYHMHNLIKYVPWGPTKETRDYLLRRLQENGDAVRSDNGWGLVKKVAKALF